MSNAADQSLVRDLAMPLVAQVAPAEADLFPLLSSAYFDDPARALAGKGATGPLAFGLPELHILITPVALAAMTAVVEFVTVQGIQRGWRVTTRALRRLLDSGPTDAAAAQAELPSDELITLTAQQWGQIRAIVVDVAQRGGVPAVKAGLIADAVVGRGIRGQEQT